MKVKTTMRYYLTPVKIAIIEMTKDNKYGWRCGERGLIYCLWECKLVSHYGNVFHNDCTNMEVSQKQK
jgi:hypothetical protein